MMNIFINGQAFEIEDGQLKIDKSKIYIGDTVISGLVGELHIKYKGKLARVIKKDNNIINGGTIEFIYPVD